MNKQEFFKQLRISRKLDLAFNFLLKDSDFLKSFQSVFYYDIGEIVYYDGFCLAKIISLDFSGAFVCSYCFRNKDSNYPSQDKVKEYFNYVDISEPYLKHLEFKQIKKQKSMFEYILESETGVKTIRNPDPNLILKYNILNKKELDGFVYK